MLADADAREAARQSIGTGTGTGTGSGTGSGTGTGGGLGGGLGGGSQGGSGFITGTLPPIGIFPPWSRSRARRDREGGSSAADDNDGGRYSGRDGEAWGSPGRSFFPSGMDEALLKLHGLWLAIVTCRWSCVVLHR